MNANNSEKTKEKLNKKALIEQQNQIKPGECNKFITTYIDPEIINNHFGSQIISSLQSLNISAEVRPQIIPEVINWTRSVQHLISSDSVNTDKRKDALENVQHILYVMQSDDLNESIQNNYLINKFRSVGNIFPNCRITLLICGLKEFCRKNSKNVGRMAFEVNLTELQISLNISHRMLDTAADLANAVMQFSKSVAEIPYKKQEAEKYANQKMYLSNDNKDCVMVKGVTGLSNLWQHQLIRLPLVALETAEAIISQYPMPRQLIDAYDNVDNDGPNLLANIPIRRAGGPLTSARKVGPELSKKVHLLYTSKDPSLVL